LQGIKRAQVNERDHMLQRGQRIHSEADGGVVHVRG
jgi:hypothetical protein